MRRVGERERARERAVERASAQLDDDVMIGCAVRRDRLKHRESQRAYAVRRGLSQSHVARLETRPGELTLGTVLDGLRPTAYGLAVVPSGSRPTLALTQVDDKAERLTTMLQEDRARFGTLRKAAADIGVTPSTLHRAIRRPATVKLGVVRRVLAAVGLALVLVHRETDMVMHPCHWDDREITPRAEGGGRRLAGHRLPLATPHGPRWWWLRWSTRAITPEPPLWTTVPPDTHPHHATGHAPYWIDAL